jgi:hypothetical protein
LESDQISSRSVNEAKARIAKLEADEARVDQTFWAKEILAQHCGHTIDLLWDSLNAATNKLEMLAAFPVGQLLLGKWEHTVTLPHGIELRLPGGLGPTLASSDWLGLLNGFAQQGWSLVQTEFRHNRFDPSETGIPKQSQYYFCAHLTNSLKPAHAMLEGDLLVDWAGEPPGTNLAQITRIDASRLTIKTRMGAPAFQPLLVDSLVPIEKAYSIDPLLVYDLDQDGFPEIILPAKNLVYKRQPDSSYKTELLCAQAPGLIFTALLANFDKDGWVDLLCAKFEGLILFRGSPNGRFDQPGQIVWSAQPHLKHAMVLTSGDIDHDGDLDVFLAQYKVPTLGQLLKPHYYDANDGFPSYLLVNDGMGGFADVTSASGLLVKRWRRTYSASFVNLDNDRHLDLAIVSDFAGLDLYRNDGHGRFSDMTSPWISDSQAFGMAHCLADFNTDGSLDLLMIGMNSATVDRLDHLRLTRPGPIGDPTMRTRMTYGNRLYLGRSAGGFEQTTFNDSIARSGWSWGCSAFDFDNDSFPDVYVANGHETKQTARDYEGEFWLHDLYVDSSVDDATATAYFDAKRARTRGQLGWSYGGYERNRLFLNQSGQSFVEAAHLVGISLPQDSRNVVATDLDLDGRVDLLVTTFEVWPDIKQTLHIYKNTLPETGNWIGLRFWGAGPGRSPLGARVTIRSGGHDAINQIVAGDSYRSQHPTTVHFGLGKVGRVEQARIQWPDGEETSLQDPEVNRYHLIPASPHEAGR